MGHNYYGEPAWPNDIAYEISLLKNGRDMWDMEIEMREMARNGGIKTDAKDRFNIHTTGVIVDWLVKAAPKVYAKYVAVNSRKEKSLLVECLNTIYGTMVGTVKWKIKDDNGKVHNFILPNTYYSSSVETRLLSPPSIKKSSLILILFFSIPSTFENICCIFNSNSFLGSI